MIARAPLAPSVAGSAGLIAALLLVGGRVYASHPSLEPFLWDCFVREHLGVPCLTCGLTRVIVMLAHGDVAGALLLAPLPALLVVVALAGGLWQLYARAYGGALPDDVINRALRSRGSKLTLLVVVLALWGYAVARSLVTGAP